MSKYLDNNGLLYFWNKIKSRFATLDSNGKVPASQLPPIYDTYVVEEGTSGMWTYRKWNNGIAEVWGHKYSQIQINTAWGSGYYATLGQPDNYPFNFIDYPTVNMTLQATHGNGVGFYNNSDYSVSNAGTVYVYNPSPATNVNTTLNIHAIGKWK